MAVFSEAEWGRYAERVEDLEEGRQDHEDRIRTLEAKVTTMIAKWGVIVAIVLAVLTLAGSYVGAHVH